MGRKANIAFYIMPMNTIFTGTTDTDTLFVMNIGSDTLHVTDITSTNSLFTVDTSSFSVDPPDGVVEVMVTYSPLVVNVDSGYIVVASNDPVAPFDSVLGPVNIKRDEQKARLINVPVVLIDDLDAHFAGPNLFLVLRPDPIGHDRPAGTRSEYHYAFQHRSCRSR